MTTPVMSLVQPAGLVRNALPKCFQSTSLPVLVHREPIRHVSTRQYRHLSTRPTAAARSSAPHQLCPRLPCPSHQRQRFLNTSSSEPKHYEACVVGAGPAGVTVLGNLLQRGVQPILWVDDSFTGGRINARYREVPSNTKVKLFSDFATAVSPFRDVIGAKSDTSPDASHESELTAFKGLDPEKGCDLSHAADMLLMLSKGLKNYPGVDAVQGRMTTATLDDKVGTWDLELRHGKGHSVSAARSERLVLCTGSSPNNSPLPVHITGIQNIDLDAALSPSKLAQLFSSAEPVSVAVIGASHSAILVLRNLYRLARDGQANLKIKWFTRHDLRYAEYMDGWILRDNTGLKGEAATWAKENLEPETLPKSDVADYLEKVRYKAGDEKAVYAQHMADVQYYVQAIGFDRDPTPELLLAGGKRIQPQFDHDSGTFSFADQKAEAAKKIKGLFGAGIAWPERVKDPHGNVEYAVGFFKFMKFIKRVSPAWN